MRAKVSSSQNSYGSEYILIHNQVVVKYSLSGTNISIQKQRYILVELKYKPFSKTRVLSSIFVNTMVRNPLAPNCSLIYPLGFHFSLIQRESAFFRDKYPKIFQLRCSLACIGYIPQYYWIKLRISYLLFLWEGNCLEFISLMGYQETNHFVVPHQGFGQKHWEYRQKVAGLDCNLLQFNSMKELQSLHWHKPQEEWLKGQRKYSCQSFVVEPYFAKLSNITLKNIKIKIMPFLKKCHLNMSYDFFDT